MKLKVNRYNHTHVPGTGFVIEEEGTADETKDLDKIELNFKALEILDGWTRNKIYYSNCPFLGRTAELDKDRCKVACNEIFPKVGSPLDRCPCNIYNHREVLTIVKKVIENYKKRSLITRAGLFFIRLYRWGSKSW
jgi:hypothetical protein